MLPLPAAAGHSPTPMGCGPKISRNLWRNGASERPAQSDLWGKAVSDDPYAILGVKREATQDEIRSSYRALAKKLHPDLNPGDKKAEEKFKEVSVAYDLLGDPEKRARFDRGEIDASGAERPQHRFYRDFAEGDASHPYATDAGFADFAGADDVLSEIFGRGGGAHP